VRKLDPVKHEQKRQQILEAAGRCFVRDGFRGASTSDICAEAKISPGHLYHYFPSKEAIVGAMTEAGLAYAAARLNHITQEPDPIAGFLAELERSKIVRDRSKQVLMLDMMAEAGRNPAMAEIMRRHSREIRTLFADFIRGGQARGQVDGALDAEMTAAVLLSVIDGAKTISIRDPKLDMPKGVELLRILVTRFLTPPPGSAPKRKPRRKSV
jgi:TetR/AcrR family transcriptional repressor of uid operon